MITIGLVSPKTKANVGSVLRAAGCYGADMVAIERSRIGSHSDVTGAATDPMKAYRRVPTIFVDDVFDGHAAGAIPVAVDLVEGAESLFTFQHPKRAFYIFGPEDGTLGKRHLDRCVKRVFIPMQGCSNLAATVNVVLYDRAMKASL